MEIATRDLLLRTVTEDDLAEVARMWAFEKGAISLQDAQQAIQYMHENHEKNALGYIYHLCLAVYEADQNQIIGWCGLDGKEAGFLHIFYLIDRACRGRGYATQCGEALLAHAFGTVGVPFVNGGCDKDNSASARVLEKIGMRRAGSAENGDPLFILEQGSWHPDKIK